MKKIVLVLIIIAIGISCSKEEQAIGQGSMIFTANGEDFVREGFTDKNGWEITFGHFYINISEPTAYMPDKENQYIKLNDDYWIDLMDYDRETGLVYIDEIKGLLLNGKSTTVEMTFHADHIFGDIEVDKDSHVNTKSVGFDFFNIFNNNNEVIITQSEMKELNDYGKLVKAVWTLGHLGEGHCESSNQSSLGINK